MLVKYVLPIEYVKNGERARSCEENVMNGVNFKAALGVNVPRHLSIERTIEGSNDVCYVLQEKCKGYNCASMSSYGAPVDRVCQELKFIYNIPFEQYKKLINDGCCLYEMGYEAKNKNLFYDDKTGFWFIDFLSYQKENAFDKDDPEKIFFALKYIVPKPRQIASVVSYDAKLTNTEREELELLEDSVAAKTLLAIKDVIPKFERYEKFYLIDKKEHEKKYLMEQGVVNKNLFKLEENDYKVFDELYGLVVDNIVNKIINSNVEFWCVETNDIRNDSSLFGLVDIWKIHKDNDIKMCNYEDEYDYERDLEKAFKNKMLKDISFRLKSVKINDNVSRFLNDMDVYEERKRFK